MKISYVTTYDASDVHRWSGLGYYIGKALEAQQTDVEYVGNLQTNPGLLLKLRSKMYRMMGKKFFMDRELSTARHYASQVKKTVKADSDLVFCPGTVPIALLESSQPKVFYTDATFAGMLGFYDSFTDVCKESIANGNFLEQKALESAKLAIYASDWAAKTAIDNYQVDPAKVKVVPFGANIVCNRDLSDIKEMVQQRSEVECKLLFLGVEWVRKGGDMAVKVAEYLNKAGLKTKLHVAGINKIPLSPLPDFVVDHGFISKSTQEGQEKLNKLFADSHFLLLPTKAEAYGLVFCEANSFGVPCIAPALGGVTTIIKNDINGKTFPLSAEPSVYGEYILSIFRNKRAYEELCYASFNEYEQRLNWKVAGRTIHQLLGSL